VDEVIPEPLGGAHRDPTATANAVKTALISTLAQLTKLPTTRYSPSAGGRSREYGRLQRGLSR
jgi:acetyl-CoA carboxylase alpha subunit